jgi:Spy/CpxP family protein refolding chaperone
MQPSLLFAHARTYGLYGLGVAVAAAAGLGWVAVASADEGTGARLIPVRQTDMPPSGLPGLPMEGPMFDHMMDELKATPAQRSQLQAIGKAARADLKPGMQAAHEARGEWMQVFAQPTVDPAAVEGLRQKMLAHQDAVSRRMTQAMLDASQVLSAEQRRTLASLMQEHMHEHGPGHMKHHAADDGMPRS